MFFPKMDTDKEKLSALYFGIGFSHREILECLAQNHGIIISDRHLRRLLRKHHLWRRKGQTDILAVAIFIEEELQTSGKLHGYRWMHHRCIQEGMVVSQATVRHLQQLLDPEGVLARRKHRLVRRRYTSTGPNFTWHMDGYDKLKPFGIAISGCIDGFSRKMMWLEAYITNNNPRVILGYFLKAVTDMRGCPRRVRADMGTENGRVEIVQKYLCKKDNSFLYGKSTANQRIEAWWGILRKQCAQYWMDILHTLLEDGHFSGDTLDKQLVQCCFMNLIQRDLDKMAETWNSHRMRPNRKYEQPGGRPVLLYTLPELLGFEDRMVTVNMDEVAECAAESVPKGDIPCSCPDVFELMCILTGENGWEMPINGYDAAALYIRLRRIIRTDLGLI